MIPNTIQCIKLYVIGYFLMQDGQGSGSSSDTGKTDSTGTSTPTISSQGELLLFECFSIAFLLLLYNTTPSVL